MLLFSEKFNKQNQWIDDTSFVSGGGFVNLVLLRINAMPLRSRTSRGCPDINMCCRAGSNDVETAQHIVQKWFRLYSWTENQTTLCNCFVYR